MNDTKSALLFYPRYTTRLILDDFTPLCSRYMWLWNISTGAVRNLWGSITRRQINSIWYLSAPRGTFWIFKELKLGDIYETVWNESEISTFAQFPIYFPELWSPWVFVCSAALQKENLITQFIFINYSLRVRSFTYRFHWCKIWYSVASDLLSFFYRTSIGVIIWHYITSVINPV